MACKCGARTYEGHLKKVEQNQASPHVYQGHAWLPDK